MATVSSPHAPFVGAVLAGGASRRMGRDKALVEVGGRPLASVAASALFTAGASRVLAVGGDAAALVRLGAGLEPVADHHPGAGPLGGILTALAEADRDGEASLVAVLACDLPHASAVAVRRVVDAVAATPTAVAAAPVLDGRLEPLHSAWRTSARPTVEAAFAAGERSPRRLLETFGAVPVEGLDPRVVRGANTPAELATAGDIGQRTVSGQTGAMRDDTGRPEITTDELAALGDAWVLDVRQPDEYEAGHVPGAVLIPLDELGARHVEVPRDADVYVICKSGGRSAAAVDALNEAGYRTTNVAGGTMAWIEAGRPTTTGPDPR